MVYPGKNKIWRLLHYPRQRSLDAIGGSAVQRVVVLGHLGQDEPFMDGQAVADRASLAVGGQDEDLPQTFKRRLQAKQALGFDSIIIGEEYVRHNVRNGRDEW